MPLSDYTDSGSCEIIIEGQRQAGLSNGDLVSTATDDSGNGNDATSSGTLRPTYRTGLLNSLPGFDFDASLSNQIAWGDILSGFTEGEIYVVLKLKAYPPPDSSPRSGLWNMGNQGADTHWSYTNGLIYDTFGSTSRKDGIDPLTDLSEWVIYSVSSSGGDWTARIDGNVIYTTSSNTVSFHTSPQFGKSLGRYFDGYMTLLVFFSEVKNSTQRGEILDLINATYFPSGGGDITGDAAFTLDSVTFAATGLLAIQASSSFTLLPIAFAATSAVAIQAVSSFVLDPVTFAATGSAQTESIGDASFTLLPVVFAATGAVAIQAASSFALLPVTFAATSAIAIQGTASFTLDAITFVSSGTHAITADASFTLSSVVFLATGIVGIPPIVVNILRLASRVTTRINLVSRVTTILDLRMSQVNTPHMGDAGTIIVVNVTKEDGTPMDLTSLDTATIETGPIGSGIKKSLDASVYGNPTDGNLSARTDSDTWDYPGVWEAFGRVQFDADNHWRGEPAQYIVGS